MTTRRIHNDDLVLILPEICNTILGDFHRISLTLVTIEGTLDFSSVHLQLSKGTRTESISTDDTHFPALFHIVVCKLRTGRCLTGTLKTDKHDDVWLAALEFVSFILG